MLKTKKKQDKIKKVKKNFDDFIAAGIVGFVFLIIFFVFLMIRGCFNMTKYNAKISKNQRSFLCCFIPSIIIFFIYSIIPIIKCCTAVGIFNEIGKEEDINNLKIINIMFIIFSFLLYAVIILLFVIFCIKRKRKDLDDINSVTNTSETNINTQNN